MVQVSASCRWLLIHCARLAAALALPNAGKRRLAKIPMIAMTTNNSIKVNPAPAHRSADFQAAVSQVSNLLRSQPITAAWLDAEALPIRKRRYSILEICHSPE